MASSRRSTTPAICWTPTSCSRRSATGPTGRPFRSPRRAAASARATPLRRPTDPRTKAGVIGAFCRAYSIPDVIDKFLPDKYTHGDAEGGKPRYTYTTGTTANGAIVEDDGLFLYSYHSTDPTCDILCNAFDLVRIHRFGHLDEDVAEDAKPGSLPSFKAMIELAANDENAAAEFSEGVAAESFEDLNDEAKAEDEDEVEDEMFEDLDRKAGAEGDKEKPKKKKKLNPLEEMNARHAVAFMKGATVALTFSRTMTLTFGTVNDLHLFYANDPMPSNTGKPEPKSVWWNKHPGRRSYKNGVVFKPGGCPDTAYNLWKGFAVEPDPNASCELFLKHVLEIICCGNERPLTSTSWAGSPT